MFYLVSAPKYSLPEGCGWILNPLSGFPYCTISFNSAWVVTRDPKYRFGTSATNEVWRDASKNSAFKTKYFQILPFLHLQGKFGPNVTHFAFGTGCRDP
jgi:hypothetical protein